MAKPGIVSKVTSLLVPSGRSARSIKTGPFRGLRMQVDLSCQKQLYVGVFEREVHKWLRRFSPNISTAFDIGAAEGEYTLYFLAKTQARKVFAFEPLETMRDLLAANLELNDLADEPGLVVSPKFVGSRDNGDECSLNSLLGEISPPCLIKIDVDGAEADILRGAGALLDTDQTYWIVETHSKELERQCISTFVSHGFNTVIVPNAWWRMILPESRCTEQNRWLVAMKPDTTSRSNGDEPEGTVKEKGFLLDVYV